MTLSTRTSRRRTGRTALLAALLVVPLAASAQSELAVAPGAGTLNDAIENDTARPADRVYVLQRGGAYPLTRVVTNSGFTLRIKAAAGAGARPVIYPGTTAAGAALGSRFLAFAGDTYLTGLYVLGVGADGVQKGIPVAVNGDGQRFVATDCVFEGGDSRYFEVNGKDTRITIRDSQIRNLVRPDNVANGRAIDYRDVPADSLLIQNTSILNVTGFIVRFGTMATSTSLRHFIFDHNTVHTTNNNLTDSGVGRRVVEYVVTNNVFVNVNGPGQSPSDTPNGIIQVGEFDGTGFSEANRRILIANNNLFTSQALADFYTQRTQQTPNSDPVIGYQLIQPSSQAFIDASAQAAASANFSERLAFQAPPSLGSYLVFLKAARDQSADRPFWAFGTDEALFPAEQPTPEVLSYPATSRAYTASRNGFPVGDLNWFPERKAAFVAGGFTAADADAPDAGAITLLGTFPNPTTGAVAVRFSLDAPGEVTVDVFDLLGRRVLATPAASADAGSAQTVALDASSLAPGVYLYRVSVQSQRDRRVLTGRLSIVR